MRTPVRMPVMNVWRVATYSVFSAAVMAALTGGCGGDDVSTGDSGSPSDSGAAQTDVTTPDVSQPDTSRPDASQQDAQQDSRADATQQDATQDGSQQDATQDASQDSSRPDTSPGDGATNDVRQDAIGVDSGPDASDASGDSSDARADASDGGVCSTTIASLASSGDGGVADSGSDGEAAAPLAPQLLFGFDNPGGLDLAWTGFTTPAVSSALLGETLTDGHTCPGALGFNLTYSGYNVSSDVHYNYGNPGLDWTGRTLLHAWVKVTTSDYTTLNGLELIVESNNYAVKRFAPFVFGTTLADGAWHETIATLGAQAAEYFPTNVNGLQVQLTTQQAQADGGPAAPPQVALLVDDVWLE